MKVWTGIKKLAKKLWDKWNKPFEFDPRTMRMSHNGPVPIRYTDEERLLIRMYYLSIAEPDNPRMKKWLDEYGPYVERRMREENWKTLRGGLLSCAVLFAIWFFLEYGLVWLCR